MSNRGGASEGPWQEAGPMRWEGGRTHKERGGANEAGSMAKEAGPRRSSPETSESHFAGGPSAQVNAAWRKRGTARLLPDFPPLLPLPRAREPAGEGARTGDCSASWSSESPLGDFLGFLSGSEG
ncbi:hypothetical protein EYF80_048126 [Liparis tanakae]|uniref:Uncharacterized protein n=1 Tax=Liparis tanakae TaxID=230148 RepID=A0A4Z2FN20_9TELE|nr:hypothetical protein EYF80_048126 [Liparis tanakae]